MLIHINKQTSIPYSSIQVITYKPTENVTAIKLRDGTWISAKGDWRKPIERGLMYRAVSITYTTNQLRA